MAQSIADVRAAIFGFIAARNPSLPPGAVTGQTSLSNSDVLDADGLRDLVVELGQLFGVAIDEDAFDLENFESVDTLAHHIDDRRSAS